MRDIVYLLPYLVFPLLFVLGWHYHTTEKLVRKLRREIRDRAQAQEELNVSRDSLAKAQAIAHLGNWEWDLKSGAFVCSDEVFRILGISPKPPVFSIEEYLRSFSPTEGQNFREELVRRQSGDSAPLRMERTLMQPGGETRVVREVTEVLCDQSGQAGRIMGTIYDVTGRIRAENALRASEERFRTLAQSAKDAIISCDADGKVLFWNTGAQVMFGFEEAEILGRDLEMIVPPRYREAHRSGMQRHRETAVFNAPESVLELVGLRKDGTEFPIEISMATWVSGENRYYSAILRDITGRRRLEQEQDRAFQVRITISALLETALEPLTLSAQLEVALAIIHSIPWLAAPGQGVIFLVDATSGMLLPGAQKGLGRGAISGAMPEMLTADLTQLLWQPALDEQKIVFVTPAMESHVGALRHGRYCVPITYHGRLLGALVLFRSGGERPHADEEEGVLLTIGHTLAGIIERRRMEEMLEQTTQALRETRLEIIRRLGRASEFRDNETGMHVVRMSHYAVVLGKAAGMSPVECELILHAAPMHDVGKIGIPDTILRKPGRLTDEEIVTMRKHAEIGASMLFGYEDEPLKTAHIMALTHHERWDGTGYPSGLKGEEIPLVGRICAVADVFDALTTPRPYKSAWSVEEATGEIQRSAGTHFDPRLVRLFLENLPEIFEIMRTYADPFPES
ncbi:MAG: PAS domain S-box protein [Magnetococcales bacterium]|nr:PAS domain S-box protein [Magnetococcales bacterium]MBF0322091.1 PAS domain S-box protein [Magnetococcales bacterium]